MRAARPSTNSSTRWSSARVRRVAAAAQRTAAAMIEPLEGRRLLTATLTGVPNWTAQGPRPMTNGQVENVAGNDPVIGAIHQVVAHPTNANRLWIGAANGGLWRTDNGGANWTPLIDQYASLSIGALELDVTDATSNTLVAGIGHFSSFTARPGGPYNGLLRTTDGGNTWTPLGQTDLAGREISGVGARGNTIIATATQLTTGIGPGVYRSTDGGANFNLISGTNGLGFGAGLSLHADPGNADRFYVGTPNALFRTDDLGANWTNITDAALNALIGGTTTNIEFAVHNNAGNNVVYVGVINNGQLAGIFRSTNQGGAWTQLDTPQTNEGGVNIGLQPREKPGSQGAVHFSLVADPNNANVVYAGGDRQPQNVGPDLIPNNNDDTWPNSIGANDFSGRLFRVDASLAAGAQAIPITHNGTNNNSSPHADSRDMTFDANGDMIEVDDGGIYRQTNPIDATGQWQYIGGDLQLAEMHDVAYDPVSNIILSGNQDTGTPEQDATNSFAWTSVSTADGGDVSVDFNSVANQSVRYTSTQNLGNFRRRVFDNAGNQVGADTFPALTPTDGIAIGTQFVTPVAANVIDGTRLLIGGNNGLFESTDSGATTTRISTQAVNRVALVAGGVRGGVNNADLLWFGSGSQVFTRTTAGGAVTATAAAFPGGNIQDIVVDPADWQTAYVTDGTGVWQTTDLGANWTNVTGNVGDNLIRALEFIGGATADAVLAGGIFGVSRMLTSAQGLWNEFGAGLPNAPIWDMDYNEGDDILVIGTLGRGAWSMSAASTTVFNDGNLVVDGTSGDDVIRLIRNANNPLILDVIVNGTTEGSFQLSVINNITVNGLAGNDNIILDGTNGTIQVLETITLNGNADNDTLEGAGGGQDGIAFNGGSGNDSLLGSEFDDAMSGGTGNDTLDGRGGADDMHGDDGLDTADYSDRTNDLVIDLDDNADDGEAGENDNVHSDIETVLGGSGDDSITGSNADNLLLGNDGNDTLNGEGGNDTLQGNAGQDSIHGGIGNDSIIGGDDDDQLFGEAGNDTLRGNAGNDSLGGGPGDDLMFGDAGNDTMRGGPGNDTMHGGTGDDSMEGTDGADSMFGDEGNDTMHGGPGNDTMFGGTGNDSMFGDDGDDSMFGEEGNDLLNGGAGSDFMDGGPGFDSLLGGAGNDTILGGADDDYIEGNEDNDSILGGGGEDDLIGGSSIAGTPDGADFIDGGDSHDVIAGDNAQITRTVASGGDFERYNAGTPAGTGRGLENNAVIRTVTLLDNTTIGGNDTLVGGAGPDSGDDTIHGQFADDTISAGDGHDDITGGVGADTIDGGAGDDGILGDMGTITPDLLDGSTQQFISSQDSKVQATIDTAGTRKRLVSLNASDLDGADSITSGTGNDSAHGGGAADTIAGNDGADALFGNTGPDSIAGGAGDDHLYGGADNDQLDGQAGADIHYGGGGDDALYADQVGDRLADWFGNFNDFYVPGQSYGAKVIIRSPAPAMRDFFTYLAAGDGAIDPFEEIDMIVPPSTENTGPGGTTK